MTDTLLYVRQFMSAYWIVVIKESSETGDRDMLKMFAQTDKQGEPSASEIFDAAAHFGGRRPEGCIQTIRTVGTFQPDKRVLTKMATLSAFASGNSKFWDARNA
jgi:hypothetical protein